LNYLYLIEYSYVIQEFAAVVDDLVRVAVVVVNSAFVVNYNFVLIYALNYYYY
jgi:hypothetical protein